MKSRTLYISDLDGTLLNKNKEVSQFTKSVLNTFIDEGGNFSIATARTAASACKILSGLNINTPIVLMNGAVIYDLCKNIYLKTEIIFRKTARGIIEILKENEISGFMYAIYRDKLVTYYENLQDKPLRDFYDERVQKYYKSFEQVDNFIDKITEDNIIYFTLIAEYDQLLTVHKIISENSDIDMSLYKDIYDENLWYLEIYSTHASKYNAVKYIREKYKFDKIIGFGDNHNDIPLLKACDEFYSVSNAICELKEKATGIIGSNQSDGVSRFIEMNELGGRFSTIV